MGGIALLAMMVRMSGLFPPHFLHPLLPTPDPAVAAAKDAVVEAAFSYVKASRTGCEPTMHPWAKLLASVDALESLQSPPHPVAKLIEIAKVVSLVVSTSYDYDLCAAVTGAEAWMKEQGK